jgi:hypothetical protein
METSTHSQGDQSKAKAKVQHAANAKWIYNAGHMVSAEGDEEEEWNSPRVTSGRKEARGASEQQEEKEEGESETGERGASEQQEAKEEEEEPETGELHRVLSASNCLRGFRDINNANGFDLSGDGFKKDSSPKWPSNLAPHNPIRKILQRRSGAKQKRDRQRSSIKDALKNLDL